MEGPKGRRRKAPESQGEWVWVGCVHPQCLGTCWNFRRKSAHVGAFCRRWLSSCCSRWLHQRSPSVSALMKIRQLRNQDCHCATKRKSCGARQVDASATVQRTVDTRVETVKSARDLGIFIDCNLMMGTHVQRAAKRLTYRVSSCYHCC